MTASGLTEAPEYGALVYVPNDAWLWGAILIGATAAMRVCDEHGLEPIGTLTLYAKATDRLGRPAAPEGMYALGWVFRLDG